MAFIYEISTSIKIKFNTMAETLVRQVADLEKMDYSMLNFSEQQIKLKNDGTRKILIREALTCWEYQHLILTSPNIEVPEYVEPVLERIQDNLGFNRSY